MDGYLPTVVLQLQWLHIVFRHWGSVMQNRGQHAVQRVQTHLDFYWILSQTLSLRTPSSFHILGCLASSLTNTFSCLHSWNSTAYSTFVSMDTLALRGVGAGSRMDFPCTRDGRTWVKPWVGEEGGFGGGVCGLGSRCEEGRPLFGEVWTLENSNILPYATFFVCFHNIFTYDLRCDDMLKRFDFLWKLLKGWVDILVDFSQNQGQQAWMREYKSNRQKIFAQTVGNWHPGCQIWTIPDNGLVQGLTMGEVTEREWQCRSLEVMTLRQNSLIRTLTLWLSLLAPSCYHYNKPITVFVCFQFPASIKIFRWKVENWESSRRWLE